MVQAAGAGPSGGASVGPGPAFGAPSNLVFQGGPLIVEARQPSGGASVGPGPARSEPSPGGRLLASLPPIASLPGRGVIGPSNPPADPGPIRIERIPGPGDIGYKAPAGGSSYTPADAQRFLANVPTNGRAMDPGPLRIERIPGPGDIGHKASEPTLPTSSRGGLVNPQTHPSAPPGAVAQFDGVYLDKNGDMISKPGQVSVMRHPQPGEKDYELFKRLTDPNGTRDAVPMPKPGLTGNAIPMPKPGLTDNAIPMPKPGLGTGGAQAASATAPVNGVAPVQGAAAASKTEVQALELMLADPANQAMVAEFGGELKPVPKGTKVAEGIVARYGEDLGARLYQYQNAQRGVENAYAKSLDEALKNPGPNVPGAYEVKGDPGNGVPDSWKVDPVAYTRAYAAGDSTAQKAFANLHGPDPLKLVKQGNEDTGVPDKLMLNGRELTLGKPNVTEQGNTEGWLAGKVERHYTQLDPAKITKLHNPEMLWFDPQQGFVTHPDNIKGSLEEQVVLTAMVSVATWGAGAAAASAGASTMVSGGISAGVSSVLSQGLTTGNISAKGVFKAVLTSVVGSALSSTGALADTTGLSELAKSQDFMDRLGASFAQAGLKGLTSELSGGSFMSGATGSLLNSAGAEVGKLLDDQITSLLKANQLSPMEESGLRMTAKAVSAAIKQIHKGGDAAMTALAKEYLQGLGDELGVKDWLPKSKP